ncbi:MAG TPA: TonB-dependent receptor [Alphaproteobacteria bacterium]|nr:TonB-dependent receptor [Alphaproteobacteria bacterium]
MHGRVCATALTMLVLSSASVLAQAADQAPPSATLPTVEVIGTSPVPGTGIDRDKVPSNVQTLSAPDVAKQGPAGLGTSLDQRLGSVNINTNQDNPYQPDLQYRGFEASPILGTPIGVAVYQNGIRLNEPFGDNVSFDLIPDFAVNRTSIIPSNPVYGLNALGGALVLDMKNGFNFQGSEASLSGGSFGRRQLTLQNGADLGGNVATYVGGNYYQDDGFRLRSPSLVRQLYSDIGAERDRTSVHLSFTAANNYLIGVGPTPVQLVDVQRNAVFTAPQQFHDTVLMPALTANYAATDTLSFQSNVYVRSAGRKVLNGNTSDAQACDDATLLCLGNSSTALIDTSGNQIASSLLNGGTAGENDNSLITSFGAGGSLQGTETAQLLGHTNNFVMGASIDHGEVNFSSTSELGVIDPTTLVVQGLGIFINQPDGSLGPINVKTFNDYYGFYMSDTLDVTDRLSLTAGGRYNIAQIDLHDQLGGAINGNNRFSRFNPAGGLAYKILPNLTAYAGYAEANRAPTAGEIACSDPARPCSLDNFLTSDPPGLKQVVARTYEVGLRGRFGAGANGRMDWNAGLFRTDLSDDILNVPSSIINSGFFQNVGDTRRQGIEAGLGYRDDKWRMNVSYSYIDATFESPISLSSPNNPAADANGNIQVQPGNRLPGIPKNRLKLDTDYAVTDRWSIGGNLIFETSQFFFGDSSNQNAPLAGFFLVNLRSSYQVTDNVEAFVLVENLFDRKYSTFGIYGDVTKTPLPGVDNPSDPRFISVGPPLAAFGGVRIRF